MGHQRHKLMIQNDVVNTARRMSDVEYLIGDVAGLRATLKMRVVFAR